MDTPPLSLYNTLTRSQVPFEPITPQKIGLYTCGMTVYDYCHIGHARVLVFFDTIVRHFRQLGYEVDYVRNITDIDDKIIARAEENGESVNTLTQRFIDAMHQDAAQLFVLPPDHEPRAMDSMPAIINMIRTLESKDLAYQANNGDVYYRVNAFPGYGKLSGKNTDELISGMRVDVNQQKHNPLDFVLWKSAKANEPQWDSPWGPGRPGWHIECSAMSTEQLGNHFDIHGGGMDLQFPHHENEIAQSEGATDEPFANHWLHVGFVRINEEKMSKSLNNFFTIREVLEQYDGESIRLFILNSHYRSPLNYADSQLDSARSALTRLYTALRGFDLSHPTDIADDSPYQQRFIAAMNDDFNTSKAIAVLFDLTHDINKCRSTDTHEAALLANQLKTLGNRLGLLNQPAEDFFQQQTTDNNDSLNEADIQALIEERNQARKSRNFQRADDIRTQLEDAGILLEDSAQGTLWKRA
jgi:cysteinyl-tRNA synthetase